MQSQSRLVWMGLIIAIGFGLGIEALKSTRKASDESSWRSSLFGMNEFDDGTTGISHGRSGGDRQKAERARSRLLRGRVAGLSGLRGTEANLAPAALAANMTITGAPNLANPQTINSDEAKKKADEIAKKKKKKKKKKKSDPTGANDNATSPAPSDSGSSNKNSNPGGGISHVYGGGGGGMTRLLFGATAQMNEDPQTLEDWVNYILPEPNYERTMKLIKAQQERSIDSEIFHEVVAQMLADSREKMHEYAILALGASPGLKSFLLLKMANSAQSETSVLRVQSRTYLKAYSKLENLRYLASALATEAETPAVTFEALLLIQNAVTTYTPKPTTPTGGSPATAPTPAVVTRQFTSLISVLTRVAQTATDETLRKEADRTLQQVQSLVGTATPTA